MFEALNELGRRLKTRRKERKVTLQELAASTGLSAGLLSKIENARTAPSLGVVLAVAKALELNLGELFGGLDAVDSPDCVLVRAADGRRVEREDAEGMRYFLTLETALAASRLEMLRLTVDPGARRELAESDGYELLYMLRGDMRYELGPRMLELHEGDTLFFDGRVPHRPSNLGTAPAELLAFYFITERV